MKRIKSWLMAIVALTVMTGFADDARVISVNIIGGHTGDNGQSITMGSAGVVPVAAENWNNVINRTRSGDAVNETITSFKETLGAEITARPMTMQFVANNCFARRVPNQSAPTYGNGDAELAGGYLDDSPAQINVSKVPYTEYSVIVYLSSDGDGTAGNGFGPIYTNNVAMTYVNGALAQGNTGWGTRSASRQPSVTWTEGVNYMRFDHVIASSLAIKGSSSGNPSGTRTGLAGIQIICTGELITSYKATISGNTSWANIQWTKGTETMSSASLPTDAICELEVTGASTVTFDAANPVTLASLKISGTGATCAVENLHPTGDTWTTNIVTAVIFGDSVSVISPTIAGYSVASSFSTGWTLSGGPSVTFTPSTSVDWTGKTLPSYANCLASAGTGNTGFNNATYYQTLGTTPAIVVQIAGGGGDAAGLYGLGYQPHGSTLTMDVYLKVTGGSFKIVTAGQEAHYTTDKHPINLTGNQLTDISGGTVAFVAGAGTKGGSNVTLTGDAGVTISGTAQITGSVIGGWTSAHNSTPVVNGNTSVLVKNVQTTANGATQDGLPSGYIIGGSSFHANQDSKATINGNTSVTIDLPSDATGTFLKTIVGGNYAQTGAFALTGTTTVTINAPNEVTFSKDIIGGSRRISGTGNVGGKSTVTINGGTYTGTIYAGSLGDANCTSQGGAELILNGGVYKGGLNDGYASSSLLTLGANVTFNGARIGNYGSIAVASANTTLTVAGNLTFGRSEVTPFTAPTTTINVTDNATIAGPAGVSLAAGNSLAFSVAEDKVLKLDMPITGEGSLALTNGKIQLTSAARAKPILFSEGTALELVVDKLRDNGTITLTVVEGSIEPSVTLVTAAGTSVSTRSKNLDGTTLTVTYDATLTIDDLSGANCWYDFEFNGSLQSIGQVTTTLGRDNGPFWVVATNDSTVVTNGVYVRTLPYMAPTYPTEWTASVYAVMPKVKNQLLMSFGTTAAGCIALVKGDGDEDVLLVRTLGDSAYVVMASMTVPHATTVNHLYSFVKRANSVEIYLDKTLWLTYNSDTTISFGNGFQIGSLHGGVGNTGLLRTGDNGGNPRVIDETVVASIDTLRMYNVALSVAAVQVLAEEFPYVSPYGTFTRAPSAAEDWIKTDAWTNGTEAASVPSNGAAVRISPRAASSLALNLAEDMTVDSLTIDAANSTSPFEIKRITNGSALTVVGLTDIRVLTTVDGEKVKLDGPVHVAAGTTLTFDLSQLSNPGYRTSFTVVKTGLITVGENATVTITPPAFPGWTFTNEVINGCFQVVAISPYQSPFTGYAPDTGGACDWSNLTWLDANNAPLPEGFEWTNAGDFDLVLLASVQGGGETVITLDTSVVAKTISSLSTSPVVLRKAESATINAQTFDFSDESADTGMQTVDFTTGSAAVIAGSNTVLNHAGTGALTIAAGKKATLGDGVTMGSYANAGTLFVRGNRTGTLANISGTVEYEQLTTGDVTVGFANTWLVRDGDRVEFTANTARFDTTNVRIEGGTIVSSMSNGFWFGSGTTVTQSGGVVTNAMTGVGGSNGFLLGYSRGTTYTLTDGVLAVPFSDINFWQGNSSLTQRGGTVTAKGLRNGTNQTGNRYALEGGTLVLGSRGTTSSGNNVVGFTLDGGTLTTFESENTTFSWPIAVSTNHAVSTLKSSEGRSLTISGAISGGSASSKLCVDGGTVVLSGANTYTGGTIVSNGTLRVEGAGRLGTGDVTVAGGQLILASGGTNAGQLLVEANGTAEILANTTYSVVTVRAGGTLVIHAGVTLTASTLSLLEPGANIQLNVDGDSVGSLYTGTAASALSIEGVRFNLVNEDGTRLPLSGVWGPVLTATMNGLSGEPSKDALPSGSWTFVVEGTGTETLKLCRTSGFSLRIR